MLMRWGEPDVPSEEPRRRVDPRPSRLRHIKAPRCKAIKICGTISSCHMPSFRGGLPFSRAVSNCSRSLASMYGSMPRGSCWPGSSSGLWPWRSFQASHRILRGRPIGGWPSRRPSASCSRSSFTRWPIPSSRGAMVCRSAASHCSFSAAWRKWKGSRQTRKPSFSWPWRDLRRASC